MERFYFREKKRKEKHALLTRTCPPALVWEVRTCPKSEFWSNSAHFGSKTEFLTKFLNDSACFLQEKLKKHIFPLKTLIFDNNQKISQTISKILKNPRFSWDSL